MRAFERIGVCGWRKFARKGRSMTFSGNKRKVQMLGPVRGVEIGLKEEAVRETKFSYILARLRKLMIFLYSIVFSLKKY